MLRVDRESVYFVGCSQSCNISPTFSFIWQERVTFLASTVRPQSACKVNVNFSACLILHLYTTSDCLCGQSSWLQIQRSVFDS
jgi:hypothetical protein